MNIFNLFNKNKIFDAVEIETTSFCNRKCSYCPNSIYDRGVNLMSEHLYRKIIDDLSEINYEGKIYPHHYGEPLTDSRLESLIRYTHQKLPKSKIILYTNGDLLTLKKIKQLVSSGVNLFKITNHDNQTPKNIEKILKDSTLNMFVEFEKFNPKQTQLYNRGGLIKISKKIKDKKCKLVNQLVIDYRGNVTLCCNDYLSKHSFGNINTSKILDIWNQNYYKKIRDKIEKGKYDLEICKKCKSVNY